MAAEMCISLCSLATMGFNQSEYSVDEYDGLVTVILILSNPLSTDITVLVKDTNGSASGIHNDLFMLDLPFFSMNCL